MYKTEETNLKTLKIYICLLTCYEPNKYVKHDSHNVFPHLVQ